MKKTTQKPQPDKNIFSEFKDPFKSYVDPFKRWGAYKDPLPVPKEEYVDPLKARNVKLPEYREYVMPDIDILTGKPRRRRVPKPKQQEEPKKSNVQPTPKSFFPSQFGSTVGSVKRSLRIQENLNF